MRPRGCASPRLRRWRFDVLNIRNLRKSFDGARRRELLRGIELDLAQGEYVAIVGESGVGKTTLLNLIAGLEEPDGGTISFDGVMLNGMDEAARSRLRRSTIGFVFQAFLLLPHLTIAQNVALPLALNALPPGERAPKVEEMLAAVGLAASAQSYPRELSGGEMQRAAIARALIHRPRLVLADEPTGNLDRDTAADVLALLRDTIKRQNAAGIIVTHSPVAAATADRVLTLTTDRLGQ